MTLAAALPRFVPLRLNLFQQWKYFSQPRGMYDWFCSQYEGLAPVHFQGQDFAMVLSPQVVREVFSADPYGYVAFWHDSFAGMNGEGSLWYWLEKGIIVKGSYLLLRCMQTTFEPTAKQSVTSCRNISNHGKVKDPFGQSIPRWIFLWMSSCVWYLAWSVMN